MWGLIATLVAALGLYYLVVYKRGFDWSRAIDAKDAGAVAIFMVVFVGFIVLGMLGVFPAERTLVVTDTPLVALKDNSSITGRLFLFGGTVDGKAVYHYYRTEGYGFVLEHIDADGVVVYEDTVDTAYLRTQWNRVTPAHKARWLHWFVYADGISAAPDELHVPPGTIKHEFALDAE